MGFWEYFKAIFVIIAIIAAAYYLTRLIAKTSGGSVRRNAGIKVVGSLPLAKDRSVAVVEIGEFAYILGVSGQRVERLDKVPAAELNMRREETAPKDFSSCFKEELKARFKKPVND
jgi:flagellar biosynthetic protein FliO